MTNDPANNVVREIDLPAAYVRLRRDGIIHVHYKKNSTLDPALQASMRTVFHELAAGTPRCFIFSAEEGFAMTKEARENFRTMRSGSPIRAYAIVASNLAQRIIANFFLTMYRPSILARVFKTSEDGAEWLRTLDQ